MVSFRCDRARGLRAGERALGGLWAGAPRRDRVVLGALVQAVHVVARRTQEGPISPPLGGAMGPKPSPERLREHEGGSSQTGLGGAARHPRARGARHPSWHMLMTACAKGGGG